MTENRSRLDILRSQPFALATQYDEVLLRLERIEQFLDSLPSDVRSKATQAIGTLSSGSRAEEEPPTPKPKVSTEMEDAATKLEKSAFQSQVAAPSPVGLQFLATAIDMVPPPRPRHNPDQHAEPTAALTTILGRPLQFEGATKAVSSGFDLCFSERDLLEQRDRNLEKIYSLLPAPEVTVQIINAYLEDVSWFYSILHPPAFLAEVAKFEEMLRVGRQNEVDLAWLGIFFIVSPCTLHRYLERRVLKFRRKPRSSPSVLTARRLFLSHRHRSHQSLKPLPRGTQLLCDSSICRIGRISRSSDWCSLSRSMVVRFTQYLSLAKLSN